MSEPAREPRSAPADLLPWARELLGARSVPPGASLAVVAGDASNRRYFRLSGAGVSYILAQAPPTTEKNEAFVSVRAMLARAGLRVPRLYGADLDRGYLALEDLGDRLLLRELGADNADACYAQACTDLRLLAAVDVSSLDWPRYDRTLLTEELDRFPQWFAGALLDYAMDSAERLLFRELSDALVGDALEQPRVLVHRDFHSRNLMPQADGSLGVIDFQDAVVGPVTYDLVSLLRDCYVRWPAQRVRDWALRHRDGLVEDGLLPAVDDECFLRWFDWMGLQRHIKVLGTFARLYLRDGKPEYLQDLPLVLRYVRETLQQYAGREPVFAHFDDWFEGRLRPRIEAQDWSATT